MGLTLVAYVFRASTSSGLDTRGSTLLRATSGRAARSGSATARPSPLACPFSKPHPRQEPWWFLPNERLKHQAARVDEVLRRDSRLALCRDRSMRGERRGFLLGRGLFKHGRCSGRGLVPLDRLRLARHRAGEHLVHARDRNDLEAFLDALAD